MSSRFNSEVLFLGGANPKDSPRVESRLKPLFLSVAEDAVSYSLRDFKLSPKGVFCVLEVLRKIFASRLIVAMDPLALVFLRALFIRNERIIYDRNERWPSNFKVRRRFLLQLISKTHIIFECLENLLAKEVSFVISTDYVTGKVIRANRKIIIPNRNYNFPNSISCFDSKTQSILYMGTFSIERCREDVLSFLINLSALDETAYTLHVWSRSMFHSSDLDCKELSVKFYDYTPLNKYHPALLGKYQFAILASCDDALQNVIPSKIAAYLQMGLPVVCLDESRWTRLLNRKYPEAFRIVKDVASFDVNEFREWINKSRVRYSPRKVSLEGVL